jgi:DNA-binding NarL/FixJ family response regulator
MNIIIADDYQPIRKAIAGIILTAYPDASIVQVEDGHSLVERAVSSPWDLTISDIAMPGMDGWEALARINRRFPGKPVLIVTLSWQPENILRSKNAGAAGFVPKHLLFEELIPAIRTLLSGGTYFSSTLNGAPADPSTVPFID